MAIDAAGNYYGNLPELCVTAKRRLAQNKEDMARIMKQSSHALSKKIKAFEKKYVATYL